MNKIEYLPKLHNRADIKEKQKELVELRKELIATGKLSKREKETIDEFDIVMCADAYSRNYELRILNQLVDFVKCR